MSIYFIPCFGRPLVSAPAPSPRRGPFVWRALCGLALVLSAGIAHAGSLTQSNPTALNFPVGTNKPTVYPSTITVSGATEPVANATVTLNGLNHTYLADVYALLVSPSGQSVLLMGNACGSGDATNANLTFDDAAPGQLPFAQQNLNGNVTYRPTDYNNISDLASPAPPRPYGDKLALLKGTNPNGDWKLFIYDGYSEDDGGSISGGWTLNLTLETGPTISLYTPAPGEKLPISGFTAGVITGAAFDDVAVSAVKVRLSRKRNNVNQFWDGTNWVTNWVTDSVTDSVTTVDADLTVGGNPTVSWGLNTKVPPQNKLDAGQYGIRVYAVDDLGLRSGNHDRSFTLYSDNVLPGVSITSPTSSQVVDINSLSGATVSGTATDDTGVASVKLKLQRKRGNTTEYWNGTRWVTTSATFDAAVTTVGGTSVTWQLASAIPAYKLNKGGYTLYATAYDAAGNKKTSPSRIFYLTGTPGASDAAPAASGKSAGES